MQNAITSALPPPRSFEHAFKRYSHIETGGYRNRQQGYPLEDNNSTTKSETMKRNVYDRFVLYEEVWQSPIRKVAKRYGIFDMMLKKICKQLDVPTTPRGYWAKLAAGKKVKIPNCQNRQHRGSNTAWD
jgi:hypothetical protein